jgi:acyl-CoA synthetase (AMP-forming)/AMP-acid ligase II
MEGYLQISACCQANAKVESHGYEAGDVYLHTAPLTHVGGLVSWLAMLKVGACHVTMSKFSPQGLFDLVEAHGVTAIIAVPAMIVDLIALHQVPPHPTPTPPPTPPQPPHPTHCRRNLQVQEVDNDMEVLG